MQSNDSKNTGTTSERALTRRQIDLLSIAEGFFESSILFALNKLDIFNIVGEDDKTLSQIARETSAAPESLSRLLNAGVATKFLVSNDAITFCVAEKWKPVLLRSYGDSYLGSWLSLLHYLSASMIDLDQAAVDGKPTVNLLDSKVHDDIFEFTMAMHNYAVYRGRDLVRFLDLGGCRTLLDLGCGPGTYGLELASANPDLSLFLLDLPEVLEVTREVVEKYSINEPVNYLAIDVTQQEIPDSYDVVLVSNTLHMLSEENSRKLLQRLYRNVNPGGSLIVQFQSLNDNRMGGRWPIMLDLVQMCITENGRNHSVGETREWMEDAGYKDIEYCGMTLMNTNGFLRGYRPD